MASSKQQLCETNGMHFFASVLRPLGDVETTTSHVFDDKIKAPRETPTPQ